MGGILNPLLSESKKPLQMCRGYIIQEFKVFDRKVQINLKKVLI